MMPTHQPDLKMDKGIFETLGESMRKTAAKEILFWESAIPTGIAALDERIGGLRPRELTLMAYEDALIYPLVLQQLIESVAVTQKLPVLVICFGTGLREFNVELFRAKDPQSHVWGRKGANDAEPGWKNLEPWLAAPIYVTQPIPGAGFEYLEHEIDKLVDRLGKVGLIVIEGIDHLNIWANPQYRSENPGASWADLSARAKWLAMSHNCPVVLDTRIVNNTPDAGHLANPTTRELPYQGAVANSADLVCFLEKFSYLQNGRAFQLRTGFSRNGLYALVDLVHDHDSGQIKAVSENP